MKNKIEVNQDVIKIKNEYGSIKIKNKTAWLGEIENFFVDEKHRQNGIGNKILEDAEVEAKKWGIRKLSLLCRTDNTSALKLYLRRDFRIEGLLRNHFENGIDIYILSKFI